MKEKLFLEEGIDFPFQTKSGEEETDDPVLIAAQDAFKIKYLFPWQRIVIANILDAYSNSISENPSEEINGFQIVLLPTGAGKSLCFLTPSLLLPGPTLVLYPLLALMTDQQRRMDEGGIPNVIFKGGQTDEERNENFRRIKDGAKIILTNPEVLQSNSLIEKLKECNICHIAIDEAHCVSEWGDSFRPSYLTLGEIIKTLNVKTVTAFTATASPQVLERVSNVLFEGQAHIVRSESDRPNIHYEVINTYAKKKMALKLAVEREKPLIIFCGTRKKSEDMARELTAYFGNDYVKFYHAGLEKEEKIKVEKWFYEKRDAILCCTCAYGMGVDKKDIHTVIHLEPSLTAESYIQEAGRAGRDGSIANAVLLWSYSDSKKFSLFPEESREAVIKKFAESETCRRQVLLDALGGEKAFCEGCDICKRKAPSPYAQDASMVLKYMRNHKNEFSNDELTANLLEEFNASEKNLKMNVWDTSDIEEIISQLNEEEKIHKTFSLGFYFGFSKNKLTYGRQSKLSILIYRKLQSLQKKLFRLPFFRRSLELLRQLF